MRRRTLLYRTILLVGLALFGCQARVHADNEQDYKDFVSGHKSAKGFTRIFRDEQDFYLEIPDSLIGRRVMLSSIITSSPTPSVPIGQELSSNPVYEIGQTDSLILFYNLTAPPTKKQSTKAIAHAFEKKYKSGSSVIIEATDMFDPSEEDIIDMTGLTIGNGAIYDAYYLSDKSLINSIDGYPQSIGISREVTYELSLAEKTIGIALDGKEPFSLQVQTSLTLLPEGIIEQREVDPRVGVRTVEYESFSDTDQIKSTKYASRWNLSRVHNIEFAIDSRLPKLWQDAIIDGILQWNKAFQAIGLGDVIKATVKDISLISNDPLCSSVRLGDDSDVALAARVLADKTTGEILSANVIVPGDYMTGIRRATCYTISDIDPRFRGYNLPDDAIYDVIKAQAMSIFCHCLGLQRNYAGSYAYTPEELSDPSFVREHGITASVSDDVLFNHFAADASSVIQKSIGPYDYHAIAWLYTQFQEGADIKAELKKMANEKDGSREYFFSSSQTFKTDPRAIQGDLSSDPIKCFDSGMEHLKNAISESSEWIHDKAIPETYAYLYLDWAYLRMATLLGNLSYCIGSFEKNDISSINKDVKVTPKKIQKQAIEKIFQTLRDMSWIDSQKWLLQIAGANKDVLSYTNTNMFSASKLSSRLEIVSLSERLYGNDGYTTAEFLSDMQKQILLNASKGKLSTSEENGISSYLSWLMSYSPVAKKNYSEATGGNSFAFEGDDVSLSVEPSSVDKKDLEALCYASLQKAGNVLKSGAAKASDSITKGRILYLASMVDAALGKQ